MVTNLRITQAESYRDERNGKDIPAVLQSSKGTPIFRLINVSYFLSSKLSWLPFMPSPFGLGSVHTQSTIRIQCSEIPFLILIMWQ